MRTLSWEDYSELLDDYEEESEETKIKVNVAVVEDEEISREALMAMLRTTGEYQVHGASSALAGIELLVRLRMPGIILLDIHMPERSGIELLDKIEQLPLPMLCICMSGDHDKLKEIVRDRKGAIKILEKPIGIEELFTTLDPLKRAVRRFIYNSIDEVTGLPFVKFFRKRLRFELKRALRAGKPVSVLSADGDGIKQINDAPGLGHDAGTATIMHIAKSLQRCVRGAEDLLSRTGGDEFQAILHAADEDAASVAALRAEREVELRPVEYGDLLIPVGVSVGTATIHPHEIGNDLHQTSKILLKKADDAMYRRKAQRKLDKQGNEESHPLYRSRGNRSRR